MLLPLLLSLVSVALGIAVGLGVGVRAVRPASLLAALAALLAVFVQLIPEAMHELGWIAIGVVALAFVLPLVVELGARRLQGQGRFGLEIAFAGLLVHQFADGLALGSLGLVDHDHSHDLSFVAIAAHTVALVALFVLIYRQRSGRWHALWRGVGMAIALVVGAAGVGLLPHAILGLVHPWIVALAAGVLLHVVVHPFVERWLHGPAHLAPVTEAGGAYPPAVKESSASEGPDARAVSQAR
ncbi:MAG: hypothetical protein EA397_07320 [Deltaproteobacteria bacterium]|nr:MAG: hypothetical protein EA397_07320 [Deltaproteobacteria bacterium]